MPPITQTLLIVNVAAFFLTSYLSGPLAGWLALWPLGTHFMPWQLVSYAFLHASLTHLAFNMFGLWMFGSELERLWGAQRFQVFYLASVVTAGLVQLLVNALLGSGSPTVGASGGLFGLMMGYALVFPHRRITPLIPPIPMPARVFVALYGGLELFLGVTGTASGVAHFAHLGGLLGGWLVMRYWRGLPPFGGGRRRGS